MMFLIFIKIFYGSSFMASYKTVEADEKNLQEGIDLKSIGVQKWKARKKGWT